MLFKACVLRFNFDIKNKKRRETQAKKLLMQNLQFESETARTVSVIHETKDGKEQDSNDETAESSLRSFQPFMRQQKPPKS